VVLLSGGLDATTAVARSRGLDCHALTVRHGQLHQVELEALRRVATALGARDHRVVDVDLGPLASSALPTRRSFSRRHSSSRSAGRSASTMRSRILATTPRDRLRVGAVTPVCCAEKASAMPACPIRRATLAAGDST
jgi:7-cyano-7-deazaguanine synthase in queuosine biosynthesis